MIVIKYIHPYLKLIRPHQWLKNLMLFFPPFLAGEILNISLSLSIFSFVAFSLTASATYVFNDVIDRHADLLHPKKCRRPLPAGKVSVIHAQYLASILIVVAFLVAWLGAPAIILWLFAYVVMSLLYTLVLKNILFLDLFAIAVFFIIRLQAGGATFEINISTWLFLSVFLLALFLSAGKRLGEIKVLGKTAADHRGTLSHYSPQLLDLILYITAGVVLLTYTMYSLQHTTLLLTVPLCCYGLLRYIWRVQKGQDGDPTASLIHDRHLLFVSLGWALIIGFGVYA